MRLPIQSRIPVCIQRSGIATLDLRKKFAQHFVDEGDLTMHYGKALRMIMRNEMSLDMVRQRRQDVGITEKALSYSQHRDLQLAESLRVLRVVSHFVMDTDWDSVLNGAAVGTPVPPRAYPIHSGYLDKVHPDAWTPLPPYKDEYANKNYRGKMFADYYGKEPTFTRDILRQEDDSYHATFQGTKHKFKDVVNRFVSPVPVFVGFGRSKTGFVSSENVNYQWPTLASPGGLRRESDKPQKPLPVPTILACNSFATLAHQAKTVLASAHVKDPGYAVLTRALGNIHREDFLTGDPECGISELLIRKLRLEDVRVGFAAATRQAPFDPAEQRAFLFMTYLVSCPQTVQLAVARQYTEEQLYALMAAKTTFDGLPKELRECWKAREHEYNELGPSPVFPNPVFVRRTQLPHCFVRENFAEDLKVVVKASENVPDAFFNELTMWAWASSTDLGGKYEEELRDAFTAMRGLKGKEWMMKEANILQSKGGSLITVYDAVAELSNGSTARVEFQNKLTDWMEKQELDAVLDKFALAQETLYWATTDSLRVLVDAATQDALNNAASGRSGPIPPGGFVKWVQEAFALREYKNCQENLS